MKPFIIKIFFVLVFTFITTGYLYPTYEGWEYELAIMMFVVFTGIITFVITGTVKHFQRISNNRNFIIYPLIFYVLVLIFSIIGLSTSLIKYLEYRNDFTSLYPIKPQNEELDAQFLIVISNKINPNIDSTYHDKPLKWIEDFGGLPVRKKAFEEISLDKNEDKIFWNFSKFLAFSFFIFFSLIEIRFYSKKWVQLNEKNNSKKNENIENKEPEASAETIPQEIDEIDTKIRKVKRLISQDRAKETLEIISEICPDIPHFQNQLIGLKNRLSRTKRQFNQNTIENDKILTSSNRINQAILELIDEIEKEIKE